jgi:hypothetical protein
MPPDETSGGARDDWAVVFVHGIGQPSPGSTLGRFGQPVVDYATATCGPATRLERTPGVWTLRLGDGAACRRWLLTEVHWADVVAAPTYRQLLRWLVLVAPWIVHTDALLWSERRPRRSRRRLWTAALYYTYIWVLRLIWAFVRGMLLLLAGVAAQLVLTLVGVIGLVPALRGIVVSVQRALVGSVGDSFAYLYDEQTWQRIEGRLIDAIAKAGARADRIAVVTHSQGTAVMHRALAGGRLPDHVTTWISLGSGLQKLIRLREASTRTLVGWALLRTVALAFFIASIPFWEMIPDPVRGGEKLTDLTGYALLVGIAVLLAPYRSVKRGKAHDSRLIRDPLQRYRLRWLDLYSFHDPVPGGPIAGIDSIEVYNYGSFLRDHSAYVANVEEVVRRIYELLEPPRVTEPFVARQLVQRRARRVRLRRVLWPLALGAAFALSAPLVHIAPWSVADVLMVASFVLLSVIGVDHLWRRWNAKATGLSVTDPGGRTPVGRMAWILGGGCVIALTVLTLGLAGTDAAGYDALLRFLSSWGLFLTWICGVLTVILLITLDFRAYEAARTLRTDSDHAAAPSPPLR